jgi:tripartite-type tricarboxylate transporter receptor subunit TctC
MIAALAVLAAAGLPATAQNWPTRSVTMVQPFAPGNAGDILGRIFASRLSELLGQPIIFENVSGAGGITGSARVAKSAPDGYQFLLGSSSTLAVNQAFYVKPPYKATDFAPVALIAETPIILLARKDLPANDLREFAAYAKANQAKMQYGAGGIGTITHLACALLNTRIGVDITHVPYRGGAPAMQDLIAGRTDYQCAAAELAIPQIQANLVKAITILTKDRSPVLENLAWDLRPISRPLPNWDCPRFSGRHGMGCLRQRATPRDIIDKLNAAAAEALADPAVQARLAELGQEVFPREQQTPEALRSLQKAGAEKWWPVIKDLGIKAQ